MTIFRHWLPWCWHRWWFYNRCDPARGVACQEGENLQVHSLDTRTKSRHAAWDDVGRLPLGNLQALLLRTVCNAWSCHLHGKLWNTHSGWLDFIWRSEAVVSAGVLHSAPLSLFATAHPAASEEYCGSWLESVGEQPLWCYALRASGGSSKIDCQLSYIQATLYCVTSKTREMCSIRHEAQGNECIPNCEH